MIRVRFLPATKFFSVIVLHEEKTETNE